MRSFTPSQRKELLKRIGQLDDPDLLVIEFIARTGSRECEAWRLNASQIDAEQGLVWIKAAKGSKHHWVPIPQPFAKRLQEHLLAHGHLLGPKHAPTTEDSATALMRTIWGRYRIVLMGSVGQGVGLHGLRASFIQAIYAKQSDIRLAQTLAGHVNLGSTGRYLSNIDVVKRRRGILNIIA